MPHSQDDSGGVSLNDAGREELLRVIPENFIYESPPGSQLDRAVAVAWDLRKPLLEAITNTFDDPEAEAEHISAEQELSHRRIREYQQTPKLLTEAFKTEHQHNRDLQRREQLANLEGSFPDLSPEVLKRILDKQGKGCTSIALGARWGVSPNSVSVLAFGYRERVVPWDVLTLMPDPCLLAEEGGAPISEAEAYEQLRKPVRETRVGYGGRWQSRAERQAQAAARRSESSQ